MADHNRKPPRNTDDKSYFNAEIWRSTKGIRQAAAPASRKLSQAPKRPAARKSVPAKPQVRPAPLREHPAVQSDSARTRTVPHPRATPAKRRAMSRQMMLALIIVFVIAAVLAVLGAMKLIGVFSGEYETADAFFADRDGADELGRITLDGGVLCVYQSDGKVCGAYLEKTDDGKLRARQDNWLVNIEPHSDDYGKTKQREAGELRFTARLSGNSGSAEFEKLGAVSNVYDLPDNDDNVIVWYWYET
ncbi:MAG: hypothetical protein QM689_06090 [Oscillospiraceae bacterium]